MYLNAGKNQAFIKILMSDLEVLSRKFPVPGICSLEFLFDDKEAFLQIAFHIHIQTHTHLTDVDMWGNLVYAIFPPGQICIPKY